MTPKPHLGRPAQLIAAACGALLLGGCADSPPWGAWSHAPSSSQIQAALGRPETFIYFSQYEIYRAPAGEYIYREAGQWVHRREPPVPAAVLRGSPSVKLALTDVPERRHDAVKAAYPPRPRASETLAAMP